MKRKHLFVTATLAAVSIAVVAFVTASAQQPPDAKALLDKAIAYHGGRAALQAMPNLKCSGTVESTGRMAGRSWNMVAYERADGGRRNEVTSEFRGRKVTAVEIYDGKMCKRRSRTTWDDMPLDENHERAAHRLPFLLQARERDPALAGEGNEAGTDAWRVEVQDGRGKAVLSFAKDDGRLLALEYPGTEAQGMGTKKEVTRKLVYHSFRNAGGVQIPSDIEMFKDGAFDGRLRFETVEVLKDWDATWLQVPDPRRRFIPGEELAY